MGVAYKGAKQPSAMGSQKIGSGSLKKNMSFLANANNPGSSMANYQTTYIQGVGPYPNNASYSSTATSKQATQQTKPGF